MTPPLERILCAGRCIAHLCPSYVFGMMMVSFAFQYYKHGSNFRANSGYKR
jgi:hypothetical protein